VRFCYDVIKSSQTLDLSLVTISNNSTSLNFRRNNNGTRKEKEGSQIEIS
jgi:hypothetical protein